MEPVHPDLARAARWLPRTLVPPLLAPGIRWLTRRMGPPSDSATVTARVRELPGGGSARVFVPRSPREESCVLVWIHGGGLIIGAPAQDDRVSHGFASELGLTVVAPSYPLGPANPFPAAHDALFSALRWVEDELRPDRIVLAGASAGGCLAAGLALRARESGPELAALLLVYPMLDDRTLLRDVDGRHHRCWNQRSNRAGWTAYLGSEVTGPDVSPLAAPGRAEQLAGLPPTWVGVGTHDLFLDEDRRFAQRLRDAGVDVVEEIVPGAFHGFDLVVPDAGVSKAFFGSQVSFLRGVLG